MEDINNGYNDVNGEGQTQKKRLKNGRLPNRRP